MTARDQGSEPAGYTIGYASGKGFVRVYLASGLALAFATAAYQTGNNIAIILAAAFAVVAFYNYPLIEADDARIGANEYGLFIEGFGLIAWRGIANLRISSRAVRSIEINELEITLSRPLAGAVIADWRKLPYHRLLMRLPWRMPSDDKVLVDLEPFAAEPPRILSEIQRRKRYFS